MRTLRFLSIDIRNSDLGILPFGSIADFGNVAHLSAFAHRRSSGGKTTSPQGEALAGAGLEVFSIKRRNEIVSAKGSILWDKCKGTPPVADEVPAALCLAEQSEARLRGKVGRNIKSAG